MQTQSPRAAGTTAQVAPDPLEEIDQLMQKRLEDEQRSADRSAEITKERSQFSEEFSKVCDAHVRPVMEAILERLRRSGGGGVIEERPEDLARMQDHRFILWMSLEGEIVGTPRLDRHPYLQLDADVAKRAVTVSEGDMWAGHGGNRSGPVTEWQLSEISTTKVTEEILAILRRSFQ